MALFNSAAHLKKNKWNNCKERRTVPGCGSFRPGFCMPLNANFPSCCVSAMISSHLGRRSWRKMRGSVTGPRSSSSASRGGWDTDERRRGVPMSPAKGLSLRRGDKPSSSLGCVRMRPESGASAGQNRPHSTGPDALCLPFGLAGRHGPGVAPGFGDVWIELCAPSSGSLPGRLGLEK